MGLQYLKNMVRFVSLCWALMCVGCFGEKALCDKDPSHLSCGCPAFCQGAEPYCDREAKTCKPCLEDSHCKDGFECDAAEGICFDPNTRRCVADEDCIPFGMICSPASKICVQSNTDIVCKEYDDCPNASQTKTVCLKDVDRDAGLTEEQVRQIEGRCVECEDNYHCSQGVRIELEDGNDVYEYPIICHPDLNICVQCTEQDTSNCDPRRSFCNFETGRCIERECREHDRGGSCSGFIENTVCDGQYCVFKCTEEGQVCPDGLSCNEENGLCVECTDFSECLDPQKPICYEGGLCGSCYLGSCPGDQICNQDTGVCGECEGDFDCNRNMDEGAPDRYCASQSAQCVYCLTNDHCRNSTPYCIEGQCKECTEDLHCTFDKKKSRCDLETGQCAPCNHSDQCLQPDAAHCAGQNEDGIAEDNPIFGTCVPCRNGSDCRGDSSTCSGSNGIRICVECTHEVHCQNSPKGSFCNDDLGKCVPCLRAEDCADSEDGPQCSLTLGKCVECNENAECEDPEKPICFVEYGQCVQCLNNDDCEAQLAGEAGGGGEPPAENPRDQCNPNFQCVECLENQHCQNGESCGDDGLCR